MKEQSLPSRSVYPKVNRCSNVTVPFSEVDFKVVEGGYEIN